MARVDNAVLKISNSEHAALFHVAIVITFRHAGGFAAQRGAPIKVQKLKEPLPVSRLCDFSLQEEINGELGIR